MTVYLLDLQAAGKSSSSVRHVTEQDIRFCEGAVKSLLDTIYPPLIVRELLVLQGSPNNTTTKVPMWGLKHTKTLSSGHVSRLYLSVISLSTSKPHYLCIGRQDDPTEIACVASTSLWSFVVRHCRETERCAIRDQRPALYRR